MADGFTDAIFQTECESASGGAVAGAAYLTTIQDCLSYSHLRIRSISSRGLNCQDRASAVGDVRTLFLNDSSLLRWLTCNDTSGSRA
jgi:hypothetical protein